jgi:hypothetical protein
MWPCARGSPWTRRISGIKPKLVCVWQRVCRGIIRRAANLWSSPKNSSGKRTNSAPVPSGRRSCATRLDHANLVPFKQLSKLTLATRSCRAKIFHAKDGAECRRPRNSGRLLTFAQFDPPSSSVTAAIAPEMSMEFEYRRLAATCLDLAKRTAVLADKTRLLIIAEAWLDLAERVARNASASSPCSDTERIDSGMQ